MLNYGKRCRSDRRTGGPAKRAGAVAAAFAACVFAANAATESFDVKPETRYMLSYDWKVSGSCRDFAEDPEGRSKVYDYRGSEYASERLFFGSGRRETCVARSALVPGKSGRRQHEFYTDSDTRKVRVDVLAPRDCKVRISRVSLDEVKDAPTLNVNPDFGLGLYNYSGVSGRNDNAVVLLPSPSGGVALHGGFYVYLAKTPVRPGGRYNLEMKAQGWHRKHRMDGSFVFLDAAGKRVFRSEIPRYARPAKGPDDSLVKNIEFTAPENARWVYLWLYGATVEYARITEKK